MAEHHPESPARLASIEQAIDRAPWATRLRRREAREIDSARFANVHPKHYLNQLAELQPGDGVVKIDPDTSINCHSLRAARLAAGAAVEAVELVVEGAVDNAFCAVRPPGHHAEAAAGMGFCIFNNVALAAERALNLGLERVAILDFDVHHGNGTVQIFQDRPEVLVCSSFQFPFYPGRYDQVQQPNIILTPLAERTEGAGFRKRVEADWSRALAAHKPQLVLVSAGFDAHRDDPLAGLCLDDADYRWVTQFILDLAQRYCGGRVVSLLEGGYHLDALGRCVAIHLEEMLQ